MMHQLRSASYPAVTGPDETCRVKKITNRSRIAQSAAQNFGRDDGAISILGLSRDFRGLERVKFGQC
jgi:hypothetical protein